MVIDTHKVLCIKTSIHLGPTFEIKCQKYDRQERTTGLGIVYNVIVFFIRPFREYSKPLRISNFI